MSAKKSSRPSPPEKPVRPRKQTFTFKNGDAASVLLAADFTQWQEGAIPMQHNGDGEWHAAVALAPGTYRYRFIVDGVWMDDPACTSRVANPYGAQDAVCEVK